MNKTEKIEPGGCAKGNITVPGDKSISIRAVLLSAIAEGTSQISGLGRGGDVLSAIKCIKQLGIEAEFRENGRLRINGGGLYGLIPAGEPLDCGNSGTTLRLLTGILAGQQKKYVLTGDASLQQRPMDRIITPLRSMGANIECLESEGKIPYIVHPSKLHSISYTLPVASAQVKSAVLLAGLYAKGNTTVIEPVPSRNHTELMLSSRGVNFTINENQKQISLADIRKINSQDMLIPGDISGAAFFIVLASLLPGSRLFIDNAGINNTRTGIIDILKNMGADIAFHNRRNFGGEDATDLEIKYARLKGIEISGEIIPRVIDELPILTVAAACAEGKTVIRDASELRVKETDRIRALHLNLRKMGVQVEELPDGLIIYGSSSLKGAELESFGDHRIAMAFAVAASVADGASVIKDSQWADISFPGFYNLLNHVRKTA